VTRLTVYQMSIIRAEFRAYIHGKEQGRDIHVDEFISIKGIQGLIETVDDLTLDLTEATDALSSVMHERDTLRHDLAAARERIAALEAERVAPGTVSVELPYVKSLAEQKAYLLDFLKSHGETFFAKGSTFVAALIALWNDGKIYETRADDLGRFWALRPAPNDAEPDTTNGGGIV
jgi:hypothetical protein